jgi:hypothetical protein
MTLQGKSFFILNTHHSAKDTFGSFADNRTLLSVLMYIMPSFALAIYYFKSKYHTRSFKCLINLIIMIVQVRFSRISHAVTMCTVSNSISFTLLQMSSISMYVSHEYITQRESDIADTGRM